MADTAVNIRVEYNMANINKISTKLNTASACLVQLILKIIIYIQSENGTSMFILIKLHLARQINGKALSFVWIRNN